MPRPIWKGATRFEPVTLPEGHTKRWRADPGARPTSDGHVVIDRRAAWHTDGCAGNVASNEGAARLRTKRRCVAGGAQLLRVPGARFSEPALEVDRRHLRTLSPRLAT